MTGDKKTARLLGIAVRSQSGEPMVSVDRVLVTKGTGLSGDERAGSQHREVTVLSEGSCPHSAP